MNASSLILVGPRDLRWVTEPLGQLGPADLLVRTTTGAISVGTEVQIYRGTARSHIAVSYPVMTGYENVGTVFECGTQVRAFRPGDRVLAAYGHRTHGIVPASEAIPVPDDIDDPLAVLALLSCDVAKGVRKLMPRFEESVLVTGAGAIGVLTVFLLGALGVHNVDVVEPRIERHALPLRLGARRVSTPEQADGHYSAGFECSTSNIAFAQLQELLDPGGRICIIADGNREPLVLTPGFHHKELTVVGSSDGWNYPRHAQWYFETIQGGGHPLGDLFDCRITAWQLPEFFELIATSDITPTKVLVTYPDDSAP